VYANTQQCTHKQFSIFNNNVTTKYIFEVIPFIAVFQTFIPFIAVFENFVPNIAMRKFVFPNIAVFHTFSQTILVVIDCYFRNPLISDAVDNNNNTNNKIMTI